MNRRQSSLDRPGILSPPGPFLTPSPSPSISIASPRLAPSPSISPFSQDVLLVTNNTITNTTQEQERKAATPGRRQSIHQINSGSPNAGTVVFQPSPSQSPAAATTVIGVTGNEFNTTLVGSNNISLNKKGKRLSQSQQYSIGYGQHQTTTITTSGTSSSYMVNNSSKGQTKKGLNSNNNSNITIQNNQLQQHNFLPHQAQLINPNGSPLLADSPIASPSGQIKPPTPQPQILHQFPTVLNAAGNHQLLQFLQGPQLIAAANAAIQQQQQQQQHQHQQQQQHHHQQQQRQLMSNTGSVQNIQTNIKTTKGPQQILPKPQQQQSLDNNSKNLSKTQQQQHHQHHHQQIHQISQSPQPQIITQPSSNQNGNGSNNSSPAGGNSGGQIIQLPTGNLGGQPLLLNQMPVLVQQNTPQGVQLILRPPTPQLTAAPSLVIHNSRPQQMQQNQQQPQLLRILNTNNGMQLATTPTFIVSSQANLIQQNLQQTLKANQSQTTGPITTLSGLQANPRSQQLAAAINNHIFGQNMAQLQNLQLNGNLAQIQMQNGLHGPIISQLPTQFQQSLAGFNQLAQNLNLNQLNSANLQQQIAAAAAAAAANAAFQSPPPQQQHQIPPHPQVSELQMSTGTAVGIASQNLQFSTTTPNGGGGNQQHISITSPAVTPQPQLLPSVTPEPRNPTPVLQNIVTAQQPTTTTVLVQPDNLMQIQQNLIAQQQLQHQHQQQQQIQHQHHQSLQQQIKPQPPPPKARKPAKSRKKKNQRLPMTTTMTTISQQQNPIIITTTITNPTTTTTTTSSSPPMKSFTSTGKLDLANVMKLCGIMEDEDYMMDDEPNVIQQQQLQEDAIKLNEVNLTSPSSTTMINQQQQQHQQQQQPQQQLNSNDFMITIPGQNSDMPFTFTIPANNNNNNNNQCDSKNSISDIEMTINTSNNTAIGNNSSNNTNSNVCHTNNNSDTTTKIQQQSNNNSNLIDAQNFVIKIDQNDSGQPYTISIPSISTVNDIQQTIQQQQVCHQILPTSQQQQQSQILQSNHQHLTNLQTSQSQSIQMSSRPKSLTSPTNFNNNTFTSISTTMSIANSSLTTSSNINSNNNTIITSSFANQQLQPTPTITSRMTEIQNHLIGAAAANATTILQQQQQQNTLNLNSGGMMTQSSTNNTSNIKNNAINSGNTTQTTNVCPTITTTTATVKPRRKQPVKRNGKKVADSIISTPVGNVPSQIGNIQISQIDATKITNQQMPISNVVENKIQIMPIIDNSNNNVKIGNNSSSTQQSQQIQNQIVLQQQPNNQQQQPLVQHNFDKTSTINQTQQQQQQQQQIPTTSIQQQQQTLTIPIQSNAAQTPAATLISQLTGALSLAFSEDGGRLLLRHDPNSPQDSQSQIILQAVLSGALPNITIINEPLMSDKTKTVNTGVNSTNLQKTNNNLSNPGNLSTTNSAVTTKVNLPQVNNKNQSIQLNQQQQQQFQINLQPNNIQNNQFVGIVGPGGSVVNNNSNPAIDNLSLLQKRPSLEIKKNEISQSQNVLPPPMQQQQFVQQNSTGNTTIVVNPNTPKLVALPKIDSNQQLFSLNTLNNQITHISPGQTTASLGPMERLLIVPAGINAQQLAQCMLQGQIHFDNINPVPQAITGQQQQQQQQLLPLPQQQLQQQQQSQVNRIQQQIVHPQPIQPLHQPVNQQNISTTTKQVANVAPIIDTSKTTAKLETQKKKPKPRKPKVDLTNKMASATTATLKPIQKLDLNTKPNTNPVQIVQPNTAKDHLNKQQRTVTATQFVQNSSSNTTTNSTTLTVSSSTSIHPFNSSQTLSNSGGTKLIGVTAPMQQINQNHRNMITSTSNTNNNNSGNGNNQCNNLSNTTNNNMLINNINSAAQNNTNTNLPIQLQQSQNITSARSLSTTNTNLSNTSSNVIPPLVSVNSAQQTVTRVQTIQLTPQQQQLLKTVQIQIQQLSAKLQNKNLLSTLNIPADFDPNHPMYNKPLPSLVNIQQMTDSEIHAALQRLFIEQQKILASGKVIPTMPAPGSHHNFVHSPMLQSTTSSSQATQNYMQQQQQQQQQMVNSFPATNSQQQLNTFSNIKQIPTTTGITIKSEGQTTIPSNIVQPNNHNSTMIPQQHLQQQQQSGSSQRIHIYPLQHQTQQNKPNVTNLQSNSNQFQHQNQLPIQQQQIKKENTNSINNNKQLLLPNQQQLPLHQQQQQQQFQTHGNQEEKPIVSQIQPNKTISISITDTKPTTTITNVNVKTENLPDIKLSTTLNSLPTTISAVPPVESTKPKIARHALFERQLDVDQQACVKPDYLTPFHNKEEAVKRLIRYHCLYQKDEEFLSDEEIEFEKCAIEFQNKFQGITNKFQDIILKESLLPHRTSELCLINHLLVSDIQQELLDMRAEANNQNLSSSPTTVSTLNCKSTIKKEFDFNINNNIKTVQQQQSEKNQFITNNNQDQQRSSFSSTPIEYINSSDNSNNFNYNNLIKNEIKSEPYDLNSINKYDSNSLYTTASMTIASNKISTSIITTATTSLCEQTVSTTSSVISSQNKSISTNRLYNHIGGGGQQQTTNTNVMIKNEKENLTVDFRNYQNNNKINFQSINKHEKSNYTVKKEIDNFDIESEITPSFIMKKIENILPQNATNTNQSSGINISSHSISGNSEENDYSIDFNFNGQNNNHNQHSQQQQQQVNCYDSNKFSTTINNIVGNNSSNNNASLNRTVQPSLDIVKRNEMSCLDTKLNQNEPYDEWLCIQKELNLISEKKSTLLSEQNLNNNQQNNNQIHLNHHQDNSNNKSVEKELSEIFESSPNSKDVDNQLSELFTNTPTDHVTANHLSNGDINHSPTKHQTSMHLSELINSELININHDSIANKSVETRLEAMFGESPVIEKSDTSDLVESRLEELFNEDDDDDDNDNNINRNNCIDDNNDENDTTNSSTTQNLRHFSTQQLMIGNNINHNKRSWSNHNDDDNNVINPSNKRSCLLANNNNPICGVQNNSFMESQQSQFSGGNNNSRWMIDSQFDFINQQQQNRNEREWNGIENIHINQPQQHINNINKKINFGNNKTHDLVDNTDDDYVVDKSGWHSSTTITNQTSQIANNLMQSINNQHHHTSTLQPGDVHLQDTEFPQIPNMSEDSNQMHIQHHHNLQQQHLMQTNLINQSIMQHHNASLFDNDIHNHHLQQQQQHHHHNLNASSGNMEIIGSGANLSGIGMDNVNNLGNISGGSSGAGSMTSNFDDDINRHVQNAIDSILNLQNSESDSLNFSLDNSMGSFLADSPLDHQQQQQQPPPPPHHNLQQSHLQHHQNTSILQQQHCLLTGNGNNGNVNINKRRSGRIDDLTDCLINGGASGDNSNMIHSPITPTGVSQSGLIGSTPGVGSGGIVGNNIHGITDFSCVSAGIDDAVKSIMTS